ncbi:hypothetical protein RR10_20200, partial [Acinetobacter baumannii]
MISDQLLKVEETDLNFSTLKNEKPLILNRDVSVLILPSVRQNDAFHTALLHKDLKCKAPLIEPN